MRIQKKELAAGWCVGIVLLMQISLHPAHAQDGEQGDIDIESETPERIHFQEVDVDGFADWLDLEGDFVLDLSMAGVHRDEQKTDEFMATMKGALERAGEESLSGREQTEFRFLSHYYLATLYMQKYALHEHPDDVARALEHREAALAEIEGDDRYETDRAFPELDYYGLKCYGSGDRECLQNLIDLTEKYRQMPYGEYPEWFAARMVLPGVKYYVLRGGQPEIVEEMYSYLDEVASGNDIMAVSASLLQVQRYLSEGDREKAGAILGQPPIPVQFMPQDMQQQWERVEAAVERTGSR